MRFPAPRHPRKTCGNRNTVETVCIAGPALLPLGSAHHQTFCAQRQAEFCFQASPGLQAKGGSARPCALESIWSSVTVVPSSRSSWGLRPHGPLKQQDAG